MDFILVLVLSSCFLFKQKTAYEVRISDWSSDVCSSDLRGRSSRLRPCGRGSARQRGSASVPSRGSACRPRAPRYPQRGGGTFPCPLAFALLVSRGAGEEARRREFTQLHADHVFVDRHRHELAAVVDVEGQPDELRQDGGPAR